MKGGAEPALQGDAHVLEHRKVREGGRDLERAHHALAREVGGLGARDVAAVVQDLAPGRLEELGEQVEHGGLAGAVRPDQSVDRTVAHSQIDFPDRKEPTELLGQLPGLDDVPVRHPRLRLVGADSEIAPARQRPAAPIGGAKRAVSRDRSSRAPGSRRAAGTGGVPTAGAGRGNRPAAGRCAAVLASVHHLPLAIGSTARGAVDIAGAAADLRLVLELATVRAARRSRRSRSA